MKPEPVTILRVLFCLTAASMFTTEGFKPWRDFGEEAVWNDPAFVHHVGDRGIRTLEESIKALKDGALRLFEEHGFGPYRVSLKTDDSAIGICGIFYFY